MPQVIGLTLEIWCIGLHQDHAGADAFAKVEFDLPLCSIFCLSNMLKASLRLSTALTVFQLLFGHCFFSHFWLCTATIQHFPAAVFYENNLAPIFIDVIMSISDREIYTFYFSIDTFDILLKGVLQ